MTPEEQDKKLYELRSKLCDCQTCKFAYEVVDFIEMLIGEAEAQKCHSAEDWAAYASGTFKPFPGQDEVYTTKIATEQIRARILANAFVELSFRLGAPAEILGSWVTSAWNNRGITFLQGKQRSEIDNKLDGYQS